MDVDADLNALLERVRSATGADRELDGTLWWLVSLNEDQRKHHDPFGSVERAIQNYGSAGRALEQFFDSSNSYCLARIAFKEPYTSSIDFSLGLTKRVLPGWVVDDLSQNSRLAGDPWGCQLGLYHGANPSKNMQALSGHDFPTAPLAILAATLSALIAGDQP